MERNDREETWILFPHNMEDWATRLYNMTRVPMEKATVTAVVTPHSLYFRSQPWTKHSELCLLYPYLSPMGTSVPFLSHVPSLETGSQKAFA